jgi:WD40 repeat protein
MKRFLLITLLGVCVQNTSTGQQTPKETSLPLGAVARLGAERPNPNTGRPSDRVPPSTLAFTDGGQQVIFASTGGVVVWKTKGAEQLQQFGSPNNYTGNILALDAKHKRLFLGSGSTVSFWIQKEDQWIPEEIDGASTISTDWNCRAFALSPDGSTLVLGNRKTENYTIGGKFPDTFEIRNANTRDYVAFTQATYDRFEKQDIAELAYSLDGKMLVVAYGQRFREATKVAILDPHHRFSITQELDFPRGYVRCLAVSPKDNLLAVGGGHDTNGRFEKLNSAQDHGTVLYSPTKKDPAVQLEGHTRPVLAMAFSSDGKWLVTGSEDQSIRVWDVATGKEKLKLSGHKAPVSALTFSSDGKMFASGSTDTSVLLWDFEKVLTQKPGSRWWSRSAGLLTVDISKAIHALEPYHRPTQHPSSINPGKPHELQALSDAQLRGAIDGLNKVNQQLLGTVTKPKHAQEASVEIQRAVKQLQIALTIK